MNPGYIRTTLAQFHEIKERRFKGDYGACDTLIDLSHAIERAALTERQIDVLRLVYIEDMKQEDAAQRLGVTQEAITLSISEAVRKISEGGDTYS